MNFLAHWTLLWNVTPRLNKGWIMTIWAIYCAQLNMTGMIWSKYLLIAKPLNAYFHLSSNRVRIKIRDGHSDFAVTNASWPSFCYPHNKQCLLWFHFIPTIFGQTPLFLLWTLDVIMTSLWHHPHLWPHSSPLMTSSLPMTSFYPTTTSSPEHYKYDSIS